MENKEIEEKVIEIYAAVKELLEVVIRERNNESEGINKNKIEAGEVNLRESIKLGNYTWTEFYSNDDGVYFLLDKEHEIKNIPFGEKSNNYIDSHARRVANECVPSKVALEVLGENAFVPVEIDLMSFNNSGAHMPCRGDLFGIITYDIYLNNMYCIDPSYMWLSTPYGDGFVLCVNLNGSVTYDFYSHAWAVRPFLILRPNVLVSLVEQCKTDYTPYA